MAGRRAAIVLLLLLAGVALGGDPPPRAASGGIERTPEFVSKVNAAIDAGVTWLHEAQQKDGSFAEYPMFEGAVSGLVYQTLRVCGAARDDRAAARAWDAMRHAYEKDALLVYSAAIYLMAIAEHGAREGEKRDAGAAAADRKWANEIAKCLADGQRPDGTWDYDVAGSKATLRFPPAYYDHSNTQYALLGLKAAVRCGVAVDRQVWKRSLAHFLDAQERDGPAVQRGAGDAAGKGGATFAAVNDRARGWGYQSCNSPPDAIYAPAEYSMTAAGISSVVICRSELLGTGEITGKVETESETSIWDGIAWLGQSRASRSMIPIGQYPAAQRPEILAQIDYYEAYGIERAGVLAGVDRMGPLDWYGTGAEVLVASQRDDGSWSARVEGRAVNPGTPEQRATARHVVDTCFALLFLKRGTAPVRVGAVTQGGADDINFAVAAKLEGKDLADFVDLVLARWRRAKDADVKTRLLDGATTAGPRIVEPLLLRMEDADVALRASAHALLQRATGQDFGYVADAAAELREASLAMWQKWWMTSKDRVVYDEATRKLVVR